MRSHLSALRLGSLKVRLTLASVALILVSVALTVHFTLREVRQGSERIVLESREDDAQRLAAIVSRRLIALQRALRASVTTLPPAALDESAAAVAYLEGNAVLRTMFSAIFLVAADGRVVAFSDGDGTRDTPMSFADRDYFKNTMAAKRPLISNALMSRVSGEPIIVFTMPITGASGEIAGVLGGSLRLSSRSLLDDLTQASEDRDFPASTIVTDATGQIIAHPSNAWLLRSAESEPSLKAAMTEWKARGRPIEPAGYSMRSGEFDVGVAGVPDADWLVFRTAQADSLRVGIAQGEKRARWVGLALALIGGLLTLVITAVLLAPLGRLQARALALLDDDAKVDIDWPRMGGELGELSRVFQHVIEQSQASHRDAQLLLAKMRAIMAKAPVGIALTRHRRFELVSAEFNRLLGYEAAGLDGAAPRLIYASDEFYQALGTRVAAAFEATQVFSEEIEFLRRDGTRFWGQLQGAPVSPGDAGAGTIWTLEDVSATRRERDALSYAATHDALTGLANRQHFEHSMAQQLASNAEAPSALLYIDLDGFKAVNDGASHAAGDRLLKDVAAILEARMRADDVVARLGGDEFAILLANCTHARAVGVAEEIRHRIEAHTLWWKGDPLCVGASIGVVAIDPAFQDPAAVVAAADAACYAAKRAGKNAVRAHPTVALSRVK
jgi:diguanylate cyclase (GGDEF)-like protein/PAS domain S-box-containing protein